MLMTYVADLDSCIGIDRLLQYPVHAQYAALIPWQKAIVAEGRSTPKCLIFQSTNTHQLFCTTRQRLIVMQSSNL